MLDSGVVGVAIGLILMYFLLSLVCSGANEVIEAFLRRRAKYLEGAIVDLLGPDLKQQLYKHALLEGLFPQRGRPATDQVPESKRNPPSYIASTVFSQALTSILTDGSARLTAAIDATADTVSIDSTIGFRVDQIVQVEDERMRISAVRDEAVGVSRGEDGTQAISHSPGVRMTRHRASPPTTRDLAADLRRTVGELHSGRVRESLGGLLTTANADIERWRREVENWFDKKMERVSGWYARRTRWWLFGCGVVLVLVLNADTVVVARTLWSDATLRDAVVARAGSALAADATPAPCENPACVAERLKDVKVLGLPIGWPDLRVDRWGSRSSYLNDARVPHNAAEAVLKFFGLVLTAIALALGAPFWFDLLNKVANLRSAGRPPPSTSDQR